MRLFSPFFGIALEIGKLSAFFLFAVVRTIILRCITCDYIYIYMYVIVEYNIIVYNVKNICIMFYFYII